MLQIKPGDLLTVEVLEGSRPIAAGTGVATAQQDLGMNVYLQRDSRSTAARKEGQLQFPARC